MDRVGTFGICAVAIFAAGTFGMALWAQRDTQAYRAQLAADQRSRDAEIAKEKAASTPQPVELKGDCWATLLNYTCTFTNLNDVPASSRCSHGKLSPKDNPGVSLLSIPLCSGVLEARQTREVSTQWIGGRADAVCSKPNGFGGTMLDFGKCDFDTLKD